MRRALVIAAATVLATLLALPASAHEDRKVGRHSVVVGWLEEPAYAGFKNAVQVMVHHGKEPIDKAKLEVEVLYGGKGSSTSTGPMPLEPVWASPGEYHAYVIPTRPGTYTFHVTGTLEPGERFDEYFTSGDRTFSDIHDPAEIAFPAETPEATTGDRTTEVAEATGPDPLGIAGIVVGGLALLLAATALKRRNAG